MPDHAQSSDPAVQAQLDRLERLSPGRDTLGLERISALLKALGNPQDSIPPVFHVAGTNGKGSTCAYLRGAIEAAGMTAHVYTSPHLSRFNERIRLSGRLISDHELAILLAEILDVAEAKGIAASFFEITTAAALTAFSRNRADACIVEVGLGGRLDATNIITAPAACGIAALGIDHEGFLLNQEAGVPDLPPIARIGWEKAGIAKNNVPLLTQQYPAEVNKAVAQQAAEAGAILLPRKTDWDAAIYDVHLVYRDKEGSLKLPLPRMAGVHQADNAALAIAMLRHQKAVEMPDAALAAAMEWTFWPARMQRLASGPLTLQLPPVAGVWLDGGHNRQCGEAIAAHFVDAPPRSIHLITAMLANKDAGAIIEPLLPKIASITAVPVPGHDHHPPSAFETAAKGLPVASAIDVIAAIASLSPKRTDSVLIAGTLYVAGEVLKLNGQEPD